MKQKRNFWERLSQAADLTGELPSSLPVVEIAGSQRVLIENHCGVCEYTTDRIRVKVTSGQVCILGTGLTLCHMTAGKLVILGDIFSVSMLEGGR